MKATIGFYLMWALLTAMLCGLAAQAEPARPLILTQTFDDSYPWLEPNSVAIRLEITDVLDDQPHALFHWQLQGCDPESYTCHYSPGYDLWLFTGWGYGICNDPNQSPYYDNRCSGSTPLTERRVWGFPHDWDRVIDPCDLPYPMGWFVCYWGDDTVRGPHCFHLVFDPTKGFRDADGPCQEYDPNWSYEKYWYGNPCLAPCTGCWMDELGGYDYEHFCCPLLADTMPPAVNGFSEMWYYVPSDYPGDSACDDGVCGFSDIDYFAASIPDNFTGWYNKHVQLTGSPPIYNCDFLQVNDMNVNGHVGFSDIDLFVDCISAKSRR